MSPLEFGTKDSPRPGPTSGNVDASQAAPRPDLGSDLRAGCDERSERPQPAGTRESAFVQAFLPWPVLKSREWGLCSGLSRKIRGRRRHFTVSLPPGPSRWAPRRAELYCL